MCALFLLPVFLEPVNRDEGLPPVGNAPSRCCVTPVSPSLTLLPSEQPSATSRGPRRAPPLTQHAAVFPVPHRPPLRGCRLLAGGTCCVFAPRRAFGQEQAARSDFLADFFLPFLVFSFYLSFGLITFISVSLLLSLFCMLSCVTSLSPRLLPEVVTDTLLLYECGRKTRGDKDLAHAQAAGE